MFVLGRKRSSSTFSLVSEGRVLGGCKACCCNSKSQKQNKSVAEKFDRHATLPREKDGRNNVERGISRSTRYFKE